MPENIEHNEEEIKEILEKHYDKEGKILSIISLVIGIISFTSAGACLFDIFVNGGEFSTIRIFFLIGLIFSITGFIYSLVVRKKCIKHYKGCWLTGFLFCIITFIFYVFLFVLLVIMIASLIQMFGNALGDFLDDIRKYSY